MDLVDPSLLADLIFQCHEVPLLTEAMEHPMMDSISDLPMIISDSPHTWPCDSSTSENNVVKFPYPVVEKEATPDSRGSENTIDVTFVEKGSATLDLGSEVVPVLVLQPYTQSRRSTSKRGPKSRSTHLQVMDGETTRPPIHSEHIIRERQRRDDMAAKFLTLESLLPPSSKRDRAVVVEEAILLVQGLQKKKAQLLKRRAELKLKIGPPLHESPLLSINSEGHELETEFRNSTSAINVHVAGKDGVVVEMTWNRPPPHFHSVLLQTMENLGAEVTRCCVARVADSGSFVQCFMTCSKPHVPSQVNKESIFASENVIMGALRNVLTKFS